ncbi:uncharacterized protein LOC117318630 [Pecten maximus]|uniref:uncharacterized protein LOC117318630 n=2 Tax=Pecten maximus TaxID=6579 RepID=UPI0014580D8E|nr:uncharacterized protein LOC117318630 [Pecten maximus]
MVNELDWVMQRNRRTKSRIDYRSLHEGNWNSSVSDISETNPQELSINIANQEDLFFASCAGMAEGGKSVTPRANRSLENVCIESPLVSDVDKRLEEADREIALLEKKLESARLNSALKDRRKKRDDLQRQLDDIQQDQPQSAATGLGSDTAWSQLRKDLKVSARAAFAEGTYRNFRTQWKAYFLFCEAFRKQPLPVSTEIICLYAQFLSRTFISVDSIRNYIAGVKTLHMLLNLKYDIRQYELNLVLKGLSRLNPHCPSQAKPITPQILGKIHQRLDHDDPEDTTLWCMFLFSFYLMLRKSNLMPNSSHKFDPSKHLLRQDILVEDGVLLVVVKWSKTNQFGHRIVRSPLVAIPGSPLCPLHAFVRMTDLNPARPRAPAFLKTTGKKIVPFCYPQFQQRLRELIHSVGLDAASFSSHSFRRGGATWAFSLGIPGELIQVQGDWASDAYKTYISFSLEDRLQVCRNMRDAILALHH